MFLIFLFFFFLNDTATTEIYTVYNTLSLHDALPIRGRNGGKTVPWYGHPGMFRTRRSEEHTSELQSLYTISYAVFCLKKKKKMIEKRNCSSDTSTKTDWGEQKYT